MVAEEQSFVTTELVKVDVATLVATPRGAFAKRNVVTLWLEVPSRMPRAYYFPYRVGEFAKYVVQPAVLLWI